TSVIPNLRPDVVVVPSDELTTHQRRSVLALCTGCFGEHIEALLPTFGGATHVLASVDGDLVSHALWITRWLQAGSQLPLRTAYVEALATAATHRGRGLATFVMTTLQQRIQDFELGALATLNSGWYERLAWERW